MPADQSRSVYVTGIGRVRYCRVCGAAEGACRCATQRASERADMPRDGVVRLARQSKGRGGKAVTLVYGLPGDAAEVARLGTELRRLCATGGTSKDGVVELQGDHRERLRAHLTGLGYRVKLAGG